MRKFLKVTSNVIPWTVPNIDTDVITPMKRMLRNYGELEKYAFEPYRFIGGNGDSGELNPDFPLNKPEYQGSQILLTGENFGCGSSRETAPEAIAKLGIRCLIGSSFGDIFFKNCFQQGLLPLKLKKEDLQTLAGLQADQKITVDLEKQIISLPDGEISFSVEPIRRHMLMEGLDDVQMIFSHEDEMKTFLEQDRKKRPWVYFEKGGIQA